MWIILYLTFSLISLFETSPVIKRLSRDDFSLKVTPINGQSKPAVSEYSIQILKQQNEISSTVSEAWTMKKNETAKTADMDKEAMTGITKNTAMKNQQGKEKYHIQNTSHNQKPLQQQKVEPENYNVSEVSVKIGTTSAKIGSENKSQVETRQPRNAKDLPSKVKPINDQNMQAVSMDSTRIPQNQNKISSTVNAESMKKEEPVKNAVMGTDTRICNTIKTMLKNIQEKEKQYTRKISQNKKFLEHHMTEPGNYNINEISDTSETISSKISAGKQNLIKTLHMRDVNDFLSKFKHMSDQNIQAVFMNSIRIPQKLNEISSNASAELLKKEEATKNTEAMISTRINTTVKNEQDTQKNSHNGKSLEHRKKEPENNTMSELSIKTETTSSQISVENKNEIKARQRRNANDFLSKLMNNRNIQAVSRIPQEQNEISSTVSAESMKKEDSKNADMNTEASIGTGTNTALRNQQEKDKRDTEKPSHNEKSPEHHKKEPENRTTGELSVEAGTISSKISAGNKQQVKTLHLRDVSDFLSKVESMNDHDMTAKNAEATISTVTNIALKNQQQDTQKMLPNETSLENHTKELENHAKSDLSVKTRTSNPENKNQVKERQRRGVNDFSGRIKPVDDQNMQAVSIKNEEAAKNAKMNMDATINTGINTAMRNQQKKDKHDTEKPSHNEKSPEHKEESENYTANELSVKSKTLSSKISTENKNQVETHQRRDASNVSEKVKPVNDVNMKEVSKEKEETAKNEVINTETLINTGTNIALKNQHDTENPSHNQKSPEHNKEESKNHTNNELSFMSKNENNSASNLKETTLDISKQHENSPAKKTETSEINLGKNNHNLVPDKKFASTDVNTISVSQHGNHSIKDYSENGGGIDRMGHQQDGGTPTTSHGLMLIYKNTLITSSDTPILKENKEASNKTEKDHHHHHEVTTKSSHTRDGNIYSNVSEAAHSTKSIVSTEKPTVVSKKGSTRTVEIPVSDKKELINDKIHANKELAKNKIPYVGYFEELSTKASDKTETTKKPTITRRSTAEILDLKPPFESLII